VTKRAIHTMILAIAFLVGWAVVGWPLMGMALTIFGADSDVAAVVTFVVYMAGFAAAYYAFLRRRDFAPWRIEDS